MIPPKRKGTPRPNARHGNGVGKGDGWGGPPKGASPHVDRPTFQLGNTMSSRPPNGRNELRRQRAAEMEDVLYDLATQAEREETRMNAAARLHAIYDGTPIARTVTVLGNELADLDDAALEVRRQALERELRGSARGTTPPEGGTSH